MLFADTSFRQEQVSEEFERLIVGAKDEFEKIDASRKEYLEEEESEELVLDAEKKK